MQPLSSPIVGTAAEIALDAFNMSGLELLFMKASLDRFQDSDRWSKSKFVTETVTTALRAARNDDSDAVDALREFVRLVAEKVAPSEPSAEWEPQWPAYKLRERLRAGGYELHFDYSDPDYDEDPYAKPILLRARLLPLEDPRLPLSAEITALEDDLKRLGMEVAYEHYRQAVDLLTTKQHYEAANSAIRCMFEEVVCVLAVRKGRDRTRQGDGGQAIGWLITEELLAKDDDGSYIRGLWRMTHTNGPHPGTSSAGEARDRLHALTTAARYLITKLTA